MEQPKWRLFIYNIPYSIGTKEFVELLAGLSVYGITDSHFFRNRNTSTKVEQSSFAFLGFDNGRDLIHAASRLGTYVGVNGQKLGITVNIPKVRIFVAGLPKQLTLSELFEGFSELTGSLEKLTFLSPPEKPGTNRGFCFLEYASPIEAKKAMRVLKDEGIIFGVKVILDWANPDYEATTDNSEGKTLHVRNIAPTFEGGDLFTLFTQFGIVCCVKKVKNYAFVNFFEHTGAKLAKEVLDGKLIDGLAIEVVWSKSSLPPTAFENRMAQMHPGTVDSPASTPRPRCQHLTPPSRYAKTHDSSFDGSTSFESAVSRRSGFPGPVRHGMR